MSKSKLEELINQGSKCITDKEYDKAESIFNEVLKIDSTISLPFINIGMIKMLNQQIDPAIDFFKKALDIDPRSLESYQNLGSCYFYKENFESAESMYMKALQIDPSNFNTYHNLSFLYINSQQWNKAKNPLEKIIQLDETNYQASFYLAMIYLNSKEYYPAIANFLYTLNIKQDYSSARLGLSDSYYKIGRYKSALLELSKITQELPDFVTPYIKSALIYIETDEKEKAIPLLEKSIELNDNNLDIVEILAVLYEEKGEMEKSENLYQQILIKDPENRSAFESLERIKDISDKLKQDI